MKEDHVTKTIHVYDKKAQEFYKDSLMRGALVARDRFISLLKTGANILDVACGSGRDAGIFVKEGFKVTGIDFSTELLAIAKKDIPYADFYQMDMRGMNFSENTFDGIWACAALLHLSKSELPAVLKRIFNMLKPSGIAVFVQKFGEGEGFREELSLPGEKRFYSYYTQDEFADYVRTAGFKILDIYTYKDADSNRKTQWIDCFTQKL
jgi:ubiquinone/menaquinone biosynthesis C-methylase UbiE